MSGLGATDLGEVEVILCDADGNLFASEEPAFEASCRVTNELMAALGIQRRFDAEELRLTTTGRNFRTTASDLIAAAGIGPLPAAELERWVAEERRAVTAHLSATLRPDPEVIAALRELAGRYRLAAVSSSALSRLAACFRATELAELIPGELRFSAEDSLPVPTSKPDPAIYALAGERLCIAPEQGLAIEDSSPGVRSAVAAGYRTLGNVAFVPERERPRRIEELREAGAVEVVASWEALRRLLVDAPSVAAASAARR